MWSILCDLTEWADWKALPKNTRLGWIYLLGENTLAYFFGVIKGTESCIKLSTDCRSNSIKQNDIEKKDTQHNDIHQSGTRKNDNQLNNIQQNNTQKSNTTENNTQ